MTGPYVLTEGLRMGDDQLKYEESDGGRYIIHTTKHLTAVIGDTMLDTWDCRKACANIYYEPAGEAG